MIDLSGLADDPRHKLAVFDIDGTILDHAHAPQSVIAGIRHLHTLGVVTTVSTGRSFRRVKDLLGPVFDDLISSDALLVVEHGSKVVDRAGKVIAADYLKGNELDHVVAFTEANLHIIDHLRFCSPDPSADMQVWCAKPEHVADVAETLRAKGYHAQVFSSSPRELRKRLGRAKPTNVSAKLKDYVKVENLKLHFTRSSIDSIFQDGILEFVRSIADKGRAIRAIEKHYGVPVKYMLIAGNAINDVDMLSLPAGSRVLVGTDEDAAAILPFIEGRELVIRVADPAELGRYLSGRSY